MRNNTCNRLVKGMRLIAKKYGVKIIVYRNSSLLKRDSLYGCYSWDKKCIEVDRKGCGSNINFIYVLAHELGHVIDESKTTQNNSKIEKSYEAFNTRTKNEPLPADTQKIILGCEARAFCEGDKVLAELGYKVPAQKRLDLITKAFQSYLYTLNGFRADLDPYKDNVDVGANV